MPSSHYYTTKKLKAMRIVIVMGSLAYSRLSSMCPERQYQQDMLNRPLPSRLIQWFYITCKKTKIPLLTPREIMRCLLTGLVVLAIGPLLLFANSTASCHCNATGIVAFNISVEGTVPKATATCCSTNSEYRPGVNVLRENGSDPHVIASYFSDGDCDGLTLNLTEIHCTYLIVCSSMKTVNGDEEPSNNKVNVSLQNFISCTHPPSRIEIDGLQSCPCMYKYYSENLMIMYFKISH